LNWQLWATLSDIEAFKDYYDPVAHVFPVCWLLSFHNHFWGEVWTRRNRFTAITCPPYPPLKLGLKEKKNPGRKRSTRKTDRISGKRPLGRLGLENRTEK
jgi:hypothetical protein